MPDQVTSPTGYVTVNDLKVFDADYEGIFETNTVEAALTRAYGVVNGYLSQRVTVPISPDSNGEYDALVKNWQSLLALYYLYNSSAPDKAAEFFEEVTNEAETGIKDEWLASKWSLDEQITSPEIGIQQAVKSTEANGSGALFVNTQDKYYSNVRQTITVQIVTGGASGTATFKARSNMYTSWGSTYTTSTDWQTILDEVQGYWPDADESTAYQAGDEWTIKVIPEFEVPQNSKKITTIGLRRA